MEDKLQKIMSPEVMETLKTIKQIQKRMTDPDISGLEYIVVYDKLGKEFDDFFTRYTGIFVKVIRGEDLSTIASALYYKSQVSKGLITEDKLADMLSAKYLPANLKAESDIKLKEMKKEIK